MMKIHKHNLPYRVTSCFVAIVFILMVLVPPNQGHAQTVLNLPVPGTMVTVSQSFVPPMLKGIIVHPENPFQFDFILDRGDSGLGVGDADLRPLQAESKKLIKYFLASLTIPEEELWVNLSPYEKDRIIPNEFGRTEMGRDLLAQDYILKQLTSSLMYPEDELGEKFWDTVYERAYEVYGTTEIPINTFNKVWILPEKAVVYENGDRAFIVESKLKVMMEEDYLAYRQAGLAMEHNAVGANLVFAPDARAITRIAPTENDPSIATNIIREIILPEIEREVNQGKNFSQLRQIYASHILATWYKQNIRESILNQKYSDQKKVAGIELEDKNVKQKIYDQYIEAFEKGAYNFIKEDYDPTTEQVIPRKYFSGGATLLLLGSSAIEKTNVFDPDINGSSPLKIEVILNRTERTLTAASPLENNWQDVLQLWKDENSDALINVLETSKDRESVWLALKGLGEAYTNIQTPKIIELIRPFEQDKDLDLKWAAEEAIIKIEGKSTLDILRERGLSVKESILERKLRKGEMAITVEPHSKRVKDLNDKDEVKKAELYFIRQVEYLRRAYPFAGYNLLDGPGGQQTLPPIQLARMMTRGWWSSENNFIYVGGGYEAQFIFQAVTRAKGDLEKLGDYLWKVFLIGRGKFPIVALKGDPPATLGWVKTVNFLKMINGNLKKGVKFSGEPLPFIPEYFVGAVTNVPSSNKQIKALVNYCEKKIRAGALFFQTQPVFNVEVFKGFLQEFEKMLNKLKEEGLDVSKVKLIPSVMILKSAQMVEFMDKNIPGVDVMPEQKERLTGKEGYGVLEEGIDIAVEIGNEIKELFDQYNQRLDKDNFLGGIHFMPLGNVEVMPIILFKMGLLTFEEAEPLLQEMIDNQTKYASMAEEIKNAASPLGLSEGTRRRLTDITQLEEDFEILKRVKETGQLTPEAEDVWLKGHKPDFLPRIRNEILHFILNTYDKGSLQYHKAVQKWEHIIREIVFEESGITAEADREFINQFLNDHVAMSHEEIIHQTKKVSKDVLPALSSEEIDLIERFFAILQKLKSEIDSYKMRHSRQSVVFEDGDWNDLDRSFNLLTFVMIKTGRLDKYRIQRDFEYRIGWASGRVRSKKLNSAILKLWAYGRPALSILTMNSAG